MLKTGLVCFVVGAAAAATYKYFNTEQKSTLSVSDTPKVKSIKAAALEILKTEEDKARYFVEQLAMGDKAAMMGNFQDAVAYYTNAFHVGQRATPILLETLRRTLPPLLFCMLVKQLDVEGIINIKERRQQGNHFSLKLIS